MLRRSAYIGLLLLIWLGSMTLVMLWLDAMLFGGRALGCFLLAGGVGAAMATVALAEEAAELRQSKGEPAIPRWTQWWTQAGLFRIPQPPQPWPANRAATGRTRIFPPPTPRVRPLHDLRRRGAAQDQQCPPRPHLHPTTVQGRFGRSES
jgi:hypothetical protein